MPNTLAYIVLLAWPVFAALLFADRRISTLSAAFWVIVGGYLFLPAKVEIDLPLIPPLDKNTVPAISVAVCCLLIRRMRILFVPPPGAARWLFLAMLAAPLLSAMTNPESMFDGMEYKRGLTAYDALSDIIQTYLTLLPMLMGLTLIRNSRDLLKLMQLFVLAALIYSPLVLLEIRISPQLHTWVYGFFPHSFLQQVRFDGYRPVVFIGHGLLVAIFAAVALCASAILWRSKYRLSVIPMGPILIYFAIVLLLCKSVGAWFLGFGTALSLLLLSPRIQIRVAAIIALLVTTYPLLAISGYFPDTQLIELAALFGDDRAQSIAFRLQHEERLLEHAAQKILFGWGGWGRNRLYDSITDGHWVNILGVYGAVGFLAKTGLPLSAILGGRRACRTIAEPSERAAYAGLLLITAMIMVDQIPNASLSPYFWFWVGGVMGVSARLKAARTRRYAAAARPARASRPAQRRAVRAIARGTLTRTGVER